VNLRGAIPPAAAASAVAAPRETDAYSIHTVTVDTSFIVGDSGNDAAGLASWPSPTPGGAAAAAAVAAATAAVAVPWTGAQLAEDTPIEQSQALAAPAAAKEKAAVAQQHATGGVRSWFGSSVPAQASPRAVFTTAQPSSPPRQPPPSPPRSPSPPPPSAAAAAVPAWAPPPHSTATSPVFSSYSSFAGQGGGPFSSTGGPFGAPTAPTAPAAAGALASVVSVGSSAAFFDHLSGGPPSEPNTDAPTAADIDNNDGIAPSEAEETGQGVLEDIPPLASARSSSPAPSVTTSAAASGAPHKPSKDFKELEQHIGELTDEKFTLQRALEQQTALADRLAADNESLTAQVNAAGRTAEDALAELETRRREVATARTAAAMAMAERDAYEMSAREAAERANALAVEVVALEEKVLRVKSEQLKALSAREAGGGVGAELAAATRRAEAAVGEAEKARAEKAAAQVAAQAAAAEVDSARVEVQRLRTEAAATQAGREAAMEALEEEHRRREALEDAMAAATGGGENAFGMASAFDAASALPIDQMSPVSLPPEANGHAEEAEAVQQPAARRPPAVTATAKPPASALLAAEAMLSPEVQGQEDKGQEHALSAIPPEIAALLPPAVWSPGAEGLDPGVPALAERIYRILEVLEGERAVAAAAMAEQRRETEAVRAEAAAMQARLEAAQAARELEAQEAEIEARTSVI
jgi:hypothetical protein